MSASSHFTTDAAGTPTAPGRFVEVASIAPVEFVPGLEFRLVLEGEFDFELDGEVRTMRVGDVAVVPPWVPHGAKTADTPCYELDVFTPPRKTLLEHAAAQAAGAADPA